jgi:hypothetical protein
MIVHRWRGRAEEIQGGCATERTHGFDCQHTEPEEGKKIGRRVTQLHSHSAQAQTKKSCAQPRN